MPNPMMSTNFGDLLDKAVTKLFNNRYKELPDYVGTMYDVQDSSDSFEKQSAVGALQPFQPFTGTVTYQSHNQLYDSTATHVEFASGIQIERKLYDDDRHGVWQKRATGLADAAHQTRQIHAARFLNNAFSIDTFFSTNSEGVAVCSNSHTTPSPNVSTAVGFDNLVTSSLSAVSLIAAKKQFMQYRDDQGNKKSFMANELWIPIDLMDIADEIIHSSGKVDTANNNINVLKGGFSIMPNENGWNFLTDSNNWFVMDSSARKQYLTWYDRVPLEFAQAEDMDTLVAKWRAYMRYSYVWADWRFILGASVS